MKSAHRDLPTSHLRAAQVLATAWLITGQSFAFPPPHLSVLEGFMDFPWRLELALFSTIGCFAILFTGFTRLGCIAVSFTIAFELAATKTWFSHNRLFVLALLLTIALSDRRHRWLPRAQVGLVFLCAGIDKLLAPAWRDGTFVTSFLSQLSHFGLMWSPARTVGGGENAVASMLQAFIGDGRIAGLAVIALELAIALLFFANVKHGAWLNLVFHLGVFAVTGGTMGQFFFAGLASSLLLLEDDRDLPHPLFVVGLTALLASPLTHRFLPLVLLVGWALRRARRPAT